VLARISVKLFSSELKVFLNAAGFHLKREREGAQNSTHDLLSLVLNEPSTFFYFLNHMSVILPCYRDRAEVEQRGAQERLRALPLRSVQDLPSDERWVQMELPFYQDQFTVIEDLSICVTTFNVGCKKPPSDMGALVKKEFNGKPVDIVVIGLQEVDMSASAMWKVETETAIPWIAGFAQEMEADVGGPAAASPQSAATPSQSSFLHPGVAEVSGGSNKPYVMLCSKQLVGLLLCTFVRKSLIDHVSDVQVATTATGALGSVGNKGGVAVSLTLHMTKLCFITAHLAAGQSQVNKRNEDIHTILTTTDFNVARRQSIVNQGIFDVDDIPPIKLPKDHDIVMVAGDLNYRVNLSYETAVRLAAPPGGGCCDVDALLREDQLVKEMKSLHSPWRGFVDFVPTFPPTYRYDMGTCIYDTSEKKRVPSFTDRILYWSRKPKLGDRISVGVLTSLQEVISSDHKPVQMLGTIPVRVSVAAKREAVVATLREKVTKAGLDKLTAAQTTLSDGQLDFGVQEFHHCRAQRSLFLMNKGECTASFRVFRQQTEASQGMWLRVSPQSSHVLPGDSVELNVEVVLEKQSLRWTAMWLPYRGQASVRIKSNIIVHVFGGPVHVVECVTVVQPSVFGNTLDNVIRLESNACLDAYAMATPPDVSKTVVKPRLPKELWYMCDAIMKRGPKTAGLFTEAGAPETCAELMSFLDRNNKTIPEEFPVDAIATCVLVFLSSLQESIVPAPLYQSALSAIRTGGKVPLFFVQQQLPPLHANVFLYVMSFMNFLLRPTFAQQNELTPQVVGQMLAQVLMPRPAEEGLGASTTVGGGVAASESLSVAAHHAVTPQQLRHVLQQDHDDTVRFMMYFLTPPPM
jgi:inositol polyphosphate 5-phosphatase INPP5B/F